MTYNQYIKFYGLERSKETREDWLYNEWNHGRVYRYNGEFYSVATGKKVI